MYPAPPRSYKGVYPFKIGTTSFIYPDHIIPNVKILGRYLDEIELLLFESTPDSLPSKEEITTLATLATELDLTYHIHLPLDKLPEKEIGPVCRILKQFSGVVSLEVFSYKDLTASLQFLKTFRQRYTL